MPLIRATGSGAVATLRTQVVTVGGSVAAFWGVFAANVLSGGLLMQFGVVPRTLVGLRGILFAPFIHGSVEHLVSNTVPFLILGWLVMLRDSRHFLRVTFASMLGAGLMAWLIGAPGSVHIGASGVIFGYLGFLMLAGWYARSVASIAISVLVTVLWGSVVLGVLPTQPGVSWQGHLGGFIGGILAARQFRTKR